MILNCTINTDKMLTLILLGLILFSCGVHGITAEYDPDYIKLVEVEAGVKGCFLCDNKFELEGDIEWFFNGSLINGKRFNSIPSFIVVLFKNQCCSNV